MVMAEKKKGRPSRFRLPKSASEEQVLADEAASSSTKYKNNWVLKLFREWQQQREMKVPGFKIPVVFSKIMNCTRLLLLVAK